MVLICDGLNFQIFLGQLATAARAHFCLCAAFEVDMFPGFSVRKCSAKPWESSRKSREFIWVLAVLLPACRPKKSKPNKDAHNSEI